MLTKLSIKNYLFIEELSLDFFKGFTIFSGETGAGKSIVIDALKSFLEKKTIFKSKDKPTIISAIFDIQNNLAVKKLLTDNFIITDNKENIILKKIIDNNNKTKLLINDQNVTTKLITQTANLLFEIHGQHDTNNLFNQDKHLEYLDFSIKDKNILATLAGNFEHYKNLLNKLNIIKKNQEFYQNEIIFFEEVINNLEKLDLDNNNYDELLSEKNKLKKSASIQEIKNKLQDRFSSGGNFIGEIISSQKLLFSYINDSPNFENISVEIEKILNSFANIEDLLTASENSLINSEDLEILLSNFKTSARKYQKTPNELKSFLQESNKKLCDYKKKLENLADLDKEIIEAKKIYLKNCQKVNFLREEQAKILENKIHHNLKYLHMEKTVFNIKFNELRENLWNKKGNKNISFMASTNLGMELGELSNIASGGELSRFMLSLKLALLNDNKTLIFDEIDTGVSGKTSDAMGVMLSNLAKHNQTIVITHQAQIAGKSDSHYKVTKYYQDNTTHLKVDILSKDNKIAEVARMIAGQSITPEAISAAKKLVS